MNQLSSIITAPFACAMQKEKHRVFAVRIKVLRVKDTVRQRVCAADILFMLVFIKALGPKGIWYCKEEKQWNSY